MHIVVPYDDLSTRQLLQGSELVGTCKSIAGSSLGKALGERIRHEAKSKGRKI
jgi:hypothetical protein